MCAMMAVGVEPRRFVPVTQLSVFVVIVSVPIFHCLLLKLHVLLYLCDSLLLFALNLISKNSHLAFLLPPPKTNNSRKPVGSLRLSLEKAF